MESSRPPALSHSPWLSLVEQTQPALHLLLRAYVYANEASDEPWLFAVELADLRHGGLMPSDLRWLITQGLVELQDEGSGPSSSGNGHPAEPGFCDCSRFLPTAAGYDHLQHLLQGAIGERPGASPRPSVECHLPHLLQEPIHERQAASPRSDGIVKPNWDSMLRELRVGDVLVKRYRVPAEIQELILNAFQEEAWPRRIDDPLPPVPDISPKRRLSTAITALNRNQKSRAIQFTGDGCGEGVIWACGVVTQQSVAD